ncbi:MAG: SIR2 family NAD-dependent protein deacylase [Lachnospiraceae bacterium]
MSSNVHNELKNTIASFKQLPYLFVGTGLSKRYANAPNWDELLYNIWKIVNPDKRRFDFERLRQGIGMKPNFQSGNMNSEEKKYYINPILATEIECKFLDLYYSPSENFYSTIFTEDENKEILHNNYNPFKYYIANVLKRVKLDNSLNGYNELIHLVNNKNKFAGIITTNYDTLLENIFDDFSVMVGQDNMIVANSFNIFEIFKIHGCINNPNSIVITESDYNYFNDKLKYLSAKLLTIFVEHPIIFIGYGLGDVNIRALFKEIAMCLTSEQLNKIKENFIFISPAFGKKESSSKRELYGKIIINEFILEDYSVLYKSMSHIQSTIPIKLARKLQDMVCDYVYSVEAKNTVIFGDIDSPDIDDNKTAIFFGRSETVTNIGFSYFTIDEILEDVLFDNKSYLLSEQLIEKTFKSIRSNAGTTLLPIYKYIFKLNYPIDKVPQNFNIIDDYDDANIQPNSTDKKYTKEGIYYNKIEQIIEAYPDHIPKQVANIKYSAKSIQVDDLEDYLKKHFYTDNYKKYKSQFRKLIALYDFKKYSGK